MLTPRLTLLDKLWDAHVVPNGGGEPGMPDILYVDCHLLHEVTSPQAFAELARRGLPVRRPDRSVATADHSVPTRPVGPNGRYPFVDRDTEAQVARLEANCQATGISLYGLGDPRQGVVHVIAPEQGLVRPGMTVVCGDSHTATHGAFGALALGIGTAEVTQVLATQCLLARRPSTFQVRLEGSMSHGVTAKDVILALIARIGAEGATGHALELTGSAVCQMDMEQRMSMCNMAIEAGARYGMVAPDEATFEYLAGRDESPKGLEWDRAVERWKRLPSDEGATFDRSQTLRVNELEPMITWGTSPEMAMGVREAVPDPATIADPRRRDGARKALEYMRLPVARPLLDQPVDVVFVGSCTNGRLSDLRLAASVLDGRRVHERVQMLVVPGSQRVKREAESAGLDQVFRRAGAEWREPGCSMCLGMNGDVVPPGSLAVSTSNRNFEGRQGPGSRTVLASPLTAAACAVVGAIADVREMLKP